MVKLCKMNGIRVFTAFLLCVMMLNIASISISAADETGLTVNANRFLTEAINAFNGTLSADGEGNAVLSINGEQSYISMSMKHSFRVEGANSLRILVGNASLCESMTVEYIYEDGQGELKSGLENVELLKATGVIEYIVPVKNPYGMTSLKITFNGASNGNVTIASIGIISYYSNNENYVGNIVKSEYDNLSRKAMISGILNWETVSKNNGAKIAIYSLNGNRSVDDIIADEYIASCDISLNFNITFELDKEISSAFGFFAALLTTDGKVLPIAPEFYLSSKNNGKDKISGEGFKGISTSLYGGAIETGSEVVYLDIYIDRLVSNNENGIQYIIDDKEYYIDIEYINELDEALKAYGAADVEVYFRILITAEGKDKFFYTLDPDMNAQYYSPYINNENMLSRLFAYLDYIFTRYSKNGSGNVKGIVLGRSVDLANEYNYCGKNMSMREYSEYLARLCAVVRNILDRSGRGLEVIFPISDERLGDNTVLLESSFNGGYPSELLISSMLKYIEQYEIDMSNIYFMLESDAAPIYENVNFENGSALPDDSPKYVSTVDKTHSSCLEFSNMIEGLARKYESLPKTFVYCWYASDNSIVNNYFYNYNVATSVKNVRSVVVDISSDNIDEETAKFSNIRNAYKYADTHKNEELSEDTLQKLGVDGWRDLIDGFTQMDLIKQKLLEKEFNHSIPSFVKGSYKLWDFTSSAGNIGWENLYGCQKLSVYTFSSDISRSLVAEMITMNSIGAEYGSLIYNQDNSLKVGEISGLSFDIFIPEADEEKIYEIVVTVSNDEMIIESSGVVFSGVGTIIYADIEEMDTVDSIKFNIRDLNSDAEGEAYNVCVKNISIHSVKYSDYELERMVLSGEMIDNAENDYDLNSNDMLAVIVGVVCGSIFAVAIFWGVYTVIQRNRK